MLISKQLVLVRELFLFTRVEAFILQRFLPFVHNKKKIIEDLRFLRG